MNKSWVAGFGVVLIILVAIMTGCGGCLGVLALAFEAPTKAFQANEFFAKVDVRRM